jgi:hypothetical protein
MKNPPMGFVVLWTGDFHGNDHKASETYKTCAVLIPRSDVATLEVSIDDVQVFCRLLTVPRMR